MIEKTESRRIQHEIRNILMNVWDPIGIKHEPACADEYDSYVSGVMGLLMRGEDDNAIAMHLAEIVNERMGLPATTKDMLQTVRALRGVSLDRSN